MSVGVSSGSGQSIELKFHLAKDALRFQMFTLLTCIVVYAHTMTSCTMFFSSLYPVHSPAIAAPPSAVDSFLMSSHIIAIDISSAYFIIAGFFSAYTFANISSTDKLEFCKVVVLYALVDIWIAGCLAMLLGSIYHLSQHCFRPQDLALTAIEASTCLRVFEIHQDAQAWHSLNPTAWPVPCLLFGFMLTPCTLMSNERLRLCHPQAGLLLSCTNSSLPILIISLFALLRDDSNVFFLNASSFGYRLLEFNFGVCFYNCMNLCQRAFWKLAMVMRHTSLYVIAVFVMVWWAQLGTPVSAFDCTCLRMYYFSQCIQTHHGFLMRGCVLGIALVCVILTSSDDQMHQVATVAPVHSHTMSTSIAVTLLVWPMCYFVHLLLEINFGPQLVHDNASLLVLVVQHITFAVALLWDTSWKSQAFAKTEAVFDSALRRSRAPWRRE